MALRSKHATVGRVMTLMAYLVPELRQRGSMRKVTSLELWHAAVKGKMHLQYTVPTKHTLIDNGYFLLLHAGI